MLRFPKLVAPTVEHHSHWNSVVNEEALLAQEETDLEEKYNEIRTANIGLSPIGKTTAENEQEEFEAEAEDEEADNVEEESEGEEFEQEAG